MSKDEDHPLRAHIREEGAKAGRALRAAARKAAEEASVEQRARDAWPALHAAIDAEIATANEILKEDGEYVFRLKMRPQAYDDVVQGHITIESSQGLALDSVLTVTKTAELKLVTGNTSVLHTDIADAQPAIREALVMLYREAKIR